MTIDNQTLRRLRDDVAAFAEHVVGEPLWPHQIALAKDPARIRTVCSGRQAGKSRTLAILGLHEAFRGPRRRILLVSAGEAAAKDLLAEVVHLVTSAPALAGSVVDDTASEVVLSNGSWIRSVPASPRQIRGKSIDLLVLDEAAFIGDEIWSAARFTVIARKESRIIMASTPWGREDRFFAVAYRAGERDEEGYSAHHWPSTVSPMVDDKLLETFRSTMTDREYRTEVLAEWVDAHGAFFDAAELDAGLALGGPDGSPMFDPADCFWSSCGRLQATVGVDWGFAQDANAAVALAPVPWELPFNGPGRLWIPWLSERYRVSYEAFIEELVAAGSTGGLEFGAVRAETNGVGMMPTQVLRRRLSESWTCQSIQGVTTTTTSKADAFGAIRMALQSESLVLPRHPELLKQLANLEYEQLDSGQLRIAVPERRGHDDLCMALSFAFLPSVEAAKDVPVRQRYVTFDYVNGIAYDEKEIEERAAYILRYWRGSGGPMGDLEPGQTREGLARQMAVKILYGDPEASYR